MVYLLLIVGSSPRVRPYSYCLTTNYCKHTWMCVHGIRSFVKLFALSTTEKITIVTPCIILTSCDFGALLVCRHFVLLLLCGCCLACFALRKDLAWLCGLSPPISPHVHQGKDLKTLLKRTRAWVSTVAGRRTLRHPRGQQRSGDGGAVLGGVHNHDDDDDGHVSGTPSLVDFAARADAISCRLGCLLARL